MIIDQINDVAKRNSQSRYERTTAQPKLIV